MVPTVHQLKIKDGQISCLKTIDHLHLFASVVLYEFSHLPGTGCVVVIVAVVVFVVAVVVVDLMVISFVK